MDSLHYLLVLGACLGVTLPLELALGARVYRRPRRLLGTVLPVLGVFVAWDLTALARGHWWFAERYVIGVRLLGLPLEEWLFFIVVPLCALLTFEALGRAPRRRAGPRRAGGVGPVDAPRNPTRPPAAVDARSAHGR
jgi:lycopene cyclase domain-containing protein